jgi:hypothetical protein
LIWITTWSLEILFRKPGALPGATALAQARASKVFTAEHEAFWVAARNVHGEAAGTRALVEVLLVHRHHLDRVDVLAGITAALTVGSTSPDVVALEALRAAERRGATAGPDDANPCGRVFILAEHRSAAVPADTAAMDWALARQQAIENALAARHLSNATLVLYEVSSAALEGRICPLGAIGHARDGVKGRLPARTVTPRS